MRIASEASAPTSIMNSTRRILDLAIQLMAVSQYFTNSVSMLRNWSMDRATADKQFETTFKIHSLTRELADQCISANPIIKRVKQTF